MNLVVVNLALQPERWAATRRNLEALGLRPERMGAVLGSAMSLDERVRLYDPGLNSIQYHKPLQPGEIGCYASHLDAWRRLLASGETCLAVFEDDVEARPALPAVLDAIAALPRDWDLVKLVGRPVEKIRSQHPLVEGHALVAYRRVPSFTSAYVVSRRGAAKLLANRIPFGRPVDVDLRHWWECDLRIFGVQPYPVRPAAERPASMMENRRVPVALRTRLHKLALQLRYSTLNAWHAARPAQWQLGEQESGAPIDPWGRPDLG
jgi:glycosyl transferase family 25